MSSNEPDRMSAALRRNIEAMEKRRVREAAAATREERAIEAVTDFMGSMQFVYLNVALYVAWIVLNLSLVPGVPKFDPRSSGWPWRHPSKRCF